MRAYLAICDESHRVCSGSLEAEPIWDSPDELALSLAVLSERALVGVLCTRDKGCNSGADDELRVLDVATESDYCSTEVGTDDRTWRANHIDAFLICWIQGSISHFDKDFIRLEFWHSDLSNRRCALLTVSHRLEGGLTVSCCTKARIVFGSAFVILRLGQCEYYCYLL